MATTEITKRFRPNAIGTEDNWNLKRGSNKVAATDPGEPLNHDDGGSWLNAAPAVKQSYYIARDFLESMGTINELRVHCRHDPILSVNDSVKVSVALTAGPTWVTSSGLTHGGGNWGDSSVALARPGGGGWTEADLRDTTFQFAVENVAAEANGVTSLWVEVDYLPTDESGGAIPPEFPARKLRRSHIPVGIFEAQLRADALDIDLMDDFEVVHSQGPHAGGSGWVDANPRKFRCIKSDLDHNTMKVSMKAIDLHDYAAMFWHTGISPYNVRSDERYPDGPAVLHPGATETFTRASKGWILDASDRIAEVSSDNKRIGPNGIRVEMANTNHIRNSAFFNSYTEWVRSSTILTELDTSNTLFYDAVATGFAGLNQTLKLTGTTSAIGAGSVNQIVTGTTLGGEEGFYVVAWHKDNSTHAAGIRIHSTSASKDFNASTTAWVNPTYINRLESSTSNWLRSTLAGEMTTTAGQLQLYFYGPTTDFSNVGLTQMHHVLGLGGGARASSPLPTMTVGKGTGIATENLKFSSNTGRRTASAEAGTMLARASFPFAYPSPGAVISTGIEHAGIPILVQHYDANNWITLTQDTFCINAAGTRQQVNISCAIVLTTDMVVNLAGRWTSADGELGLPARTLSLFYNGVKTAEIQQAADIVADSSGATWVGSGPSGWGSNLQYYAVDMSHMEILPYALSSAEINARP